MSLQLKIEFDNAKQRVVVHVVDTVTNAEHGEYGAISLSLLDLAKVDLTKIGPVQLTQFGTQGASPIYFLASGTQMKGSDGNMHGLVIKEVKTCAGGLQRTCFAMVSDTFKAPDDP